MKRLGTFLAAVIICALSDLAQSADLSTSDPASGLKPGQYKVIDGVMHTYAVAPGSRPAFVVGLPDQFQRRLAPSIAVLQSKTASQKQLAAAHKAVSDAFVEYWSEPLPTARRTLLRDAYARAARVTLQTQAEIAAGRLTNTAALDRYAEIAADLTLSEMRAFVGVRAAQERRYRQWRGTVVPDAARARVPLIAAFREFLSGDYVERDKQKAASQQVLKSPPARTEMEVVPAPFLSIYTYIYCGTNVQRCRAWVEYERPPETYWRYRVFVSEHPAASDQVWQALVALIPLDLVGDLVPNHTSILVALYKGTKRTKVIVVSWSRVGPAGGIIPRRQTHIREETSEVFEEWLIGNGSSSWVRSDDVLREVTAARFDTADAARLSARTPVGPDPIDACSYSGGTYGRAWVCHQNVNCFAWKMWNVGWAVAYGPSALRYGFGGKGYYVYLQNLGCAMRVDITGGIHNKGGAPGAGLFYQTQWPYVLNDGDDPNAYSPAEQLAAVALAQTANQLMGGKAYGLDPAKCDFVDTPIPADLIAPPYQYVSDMVVP